MMGILKLMCLQIAHRSLEKISTHCAAKGAFIGHDNRRLDVTLEVTLKVTDLVSLLFRYFSESWFQVCAERFVSHSSPRRWYFLWQKLRGPRDADMTPHHAQCFSFQPSMLVSIPLRLMRDPTQSSYLQWGSQSQREL
jgi:hypothetical protein